MKKFYTPEEVMEMSLKALQRKADAHKVTVSKKGRK